MAISVVETSARAHAGELENFDAVVQLYWPRVFRFALASTRDRDVAESLAQDCFFRAYQARERFRGDASLQTWLMQIIVNLVRDWARSRKLRFWREVAPVEPDLPLPDGSSGPERQAIAKQRMEAVWNATTHLPERQRTVFLLRFVEEMELLEIASVTGLKEGAVKSHLWRAITTVRKRVGR